MITNQTPGSWQDLQTEVARILSECGFVTEIEKPLQLARGQADIDVYAEETVHGRKNTIICECKYWQAKIPQHVIHSVRTIVQDGGINTGYIISINGFQSGSKEATAFSNLELLTWEAFQQKFLSTWYYTWFLPAYTALVDSFIEFCEPFLPAWFELMEEDDRQDLIKLHERYQVAGVILNEFTTYDQLMGTKPVPDLPLFNKFAAKGNEEFIIALFPPDLLFGVNTFRQFMTATADYINPIMQQFQSYHDKYHDPAKETGLLKTYINHG